MVFMKGVDIRMLKIGVIGLGNAGNQIARLSDQAGIRSAAINTSQQDLDNLKGGNCPIFKIGHDGGCGKNRNLAIEIIKENYTCLFKELDSMFDDMDIVYFCGASGGGTASGAMPILTHLFKTKYPEMNFGNIVILPSMYESVITHTNTINCIRDLRNYKVPFMMYDNSRCAEKNPVNLYNSINTQIISDLKILRGDATKITTPYGMIDDQDLYKLINTSGLMKISTISELKENDLDNISIDEMIVKSLKETLSVDIDRDKVIQRMGVILHLPKILLGKIDRSYTALKNYVGTPIEVFEHIAESSDNTGFISVILTGLSYPENKIIQISKHINDMQSVITVKKEEKFDAIAHSVDWTDKVISSDVRRRNETKNKTVASNDQLSDIWKHY
jgi:cell division GTPase FtsZ